MIWEQNMLMHYGIKGQQWGIRRFQNEDGTLTEEGRKRYLGDLDEQRRNLYERLTPEGRRMVDKQLVSGKSFDNAVRESMSSIENQMYGKKIAGRATGFLAGQGIKMLANRMSNSTSKAILSGVGSGLKFGNLVGAVIDTGKHFMSKGSIKDMKIGDLEELRDRSIKYQA